MASAASSALPSGFATPFFHGMAMTPLDHHSQVFAQLQSATKKLDTRRDFTSELPTEISHAIFACLPFDDLVASVQVSEQWNGIITGSGDLWRNAGIHMDRRQPLNETALQKYVGYALDNTTDKTISHVQLHRNYTKCEIPTPRVLMSFAGNVASFSGHLNLTNASACNLFSNMSQLQHLDLVVSGEALSLSCFWNASKLESLKVTYRAMTEAEDSLASVALPDECQLSELKFLAYDGVYDAPVNPDEMRATVTAAAPMLEYLSIKNCIYTSSVPVAHHVLDKIKLPKLTALIYNLGESVLPNIMCPSLKHLDLSRFEGCEDAIPLRRIWGFPNVETVVFNQSIQIADVMEDVLYFGRMKQLKTLTCVPCPVNGDDHISDWRQLLRNYSPELVTINV